MKKFTKALAALMLTLAVLFAAGCKKDPENGGNNNGGGNGGGSTPTVPTEEGMYLGIIGFNEQLNQKPISLLNNSTKASFKTFIENLRTADGTALYYADYTALKELQAYSEPPALSKVALVTFTDGLDNLSTSGSIMNPEGYGSIAAYRTALHNKIINDRIHGKTVSAYTIGLRGADVQNNLTEFQTNLEMLASTPKEDYVFEVTNMTEALERFKSIAEDLYHSVTTVNLKLKLPGGLDDGLVIRFTFDDVTDGGNSTKYVQCTYKRTSDNGRRLENVSYYGFNTGASSLNPVSQTETGTFHWFEFEGLSHSNGNAITQYDINRLQLWKKQGSVWQRDSEFTPGSSSEVTETKTSALIVLVLDCTTSLGDDFRSMQAGAKQFVEALCSSNIGGGTSGGDYSPTVTTSNVTDIDYTSAKCGGTANIDGGSNITARGVCWSTNSNPTINNYHTNDGMGVGSFTSSITGLTQGTKYYVRAFATNSAGTSYGGQKEFTTNSILATVTTASVSSITQTTAICGGNVTDDGGNTVSARGVCWSTNQNPTISNSHTTNGTGTGSFTSNLTGLNPSTTYYIKAYATSIAGTSYGEQKTFTTSNVNKPTVTTNDVTNIAPNSATCGGNVTNDGGAIVTDRGVCWSTSQNPTIEGNHSSGGAGTGSFSVNLTGLTTNTTYYVRAYATNSVGTSYGTQKSFIPKAPAPVGAIDGLFSVSATRKVYFSQGNLQYKASSGTWRFATNQYDYIGSANSNISSTYSGWIDLFGWGTSGWNCGNTYYRPWDSNNSCNECYGPSGNLTGTYSRSDWGMYNAISNGGNTTNTWRTMTWDEWEYVLHERNGKRFVKAKVNNVNGIIILPDNWNASTYALSRVNQTNAPYSANVISVSDWNNTLQANGAVFIPAAGCRAGTSMSYTGVGESGFYHSASNYSSNPIYDYHVEFDNEDFWGYNIGKSYGMAVRLVRNAN